MPNETTTAPSATETLIRKATAYSLGKNGKMGWAGKHQKDYMLFLVAEETGVAIADIEKGAFAEAIAYGGNASAMAQALAKAGVITRTERSEKKANLFAGFEG